MLRRTIECAVDTIWDLIRLVDDLHLDVKGLQQERYQLAAQAEALRIEATKDKPSFWTERSMVRLLGGGALVLAGHVADSAGVIDIAFGSGTAHSIVEW